LGRRATRTFRRKGLGFFNLLAVSGWHAKMPHN
jgi:hypothetical protein